MRVSHHFHIPVMGLAYTVDSPVKVARFGIDSVVSIVEDRLLELMRRYYCQQENIPYIPISDKEPDYRAKRTTAYLNLVKFIVDRQVQQLQNLPFTPGSEICQYFEMLPTASPARQAYLEWLSMPEGAAKTARGTWLREQIQPGSIDVNIMTKVDKDNLDATGSPIEFGSDALASLRGYAQSNLNPSSIVFSAGLNPRLFNYLERFRELDAQGLGRFEKKVVIKVSDYRSALIQGKYLAKKGIWVSEFRIESGLNCGGHAFATDGFLLGPILNEFATKKEELTVALHSLYQPAVKAKGGLIFDEPHPIRFTVQGGIGTADEAAFLLSEYGMDSTGWGSPFLLCPEATTVDAETLEKLCSAGEKDIVLSHNSPLGVRFHYLKNTSSEQEKLERIQRGKPGSPCTEKHLVSNTEFTAQPICSASIKYQQLKLSQLESAGLEPEEKERQQKAVLDKECLCVGLINAAVKAYQLPALRHQTGVTVCPGPNTAYFNKVASLREMTDHIYGRTNLLSGTSRPHMFLKELDLYLDFLAAEIQALPSGTAPGKQQINFGRNLREGIGYYGALASRLFSDSGQEAAFCSRLEAAQARLGALLVMQ